MSQMGEKSSGPDPVRATGDGEATQTFLGRDTVIRPQATAPASPSLRPPTEVAEPYLPTEVAPSHLPPDAVRFGPGVPAIPPASQAGLTAELIWRTGRPPAPPRRRPARLRRVVRAVVNDLFL